MRNLKRALSLAVASVMLLGMMVVGTGASYSDVTSAENVEAIEVLQKVGIMVGDDNGNFNPDAKVTRNEMAVIMSNLMDYRVASYAGTSPFTDVPSWAEPYVAACYTNGITAGISATTFGGSNSVTTAQAALMLQKALGYFQYPASDFDGDWQLATVKQGNLIDLFDDVDSGVTEAMTRNDVAQLVLNTLKSGTVEPDKSSITNVTAGDVKVEIGGVKYNYITSSKAYAKAIDDAEPTSATSSTKGSIVELGEKLYDGDLKCEGTTDDFGRPATTWTYNSSEIGTYADSADNVWTDKVTEKALYQAAGSAAYNNYDWTVVRNGKDVLVDVAGSAVLAYGKTSTERWQQTGPGVLTELYTDSDAETVVVTIIDQFVAEVTKVTDNGDDYTVTLSYKGTKPAGAETTFDTDVKFSKGDIVVVTVGGTEIQSIANTTTVEGNVTSIKDNEYVKVDGVTYNYNRAYCVANLINTAAGLVDLDDGGFTNPDIDNDVVIYLDVYGNAVAIEGADTTVDDYLYVIGIDKAFGDYSAKVVWADGTEEKIDIDEIDDVDANDTNLKENTVYKWSKSGSSYDLESVASVALADASIKRDRASVINGNGRSYTANSNTVFVDTDNNKVWTGYKSVVSKNAVSGSLVMDGSVIEIVFIKTSSNSAADDDDFVFISGTTPEVVNDDGDKLYLFSSAYVNGEKLENGLIVSSKSVANSINAKGLYKITEYDSDDYVSGIQLIAKALDPIGENAANYATYAKNGVIVVADASSNLTDGNQTSFSYDDNTVFVVVELKNGNTDVDTVSIGGVSDIETADDNADRDEYTTNVYVVTVEDDTDATPLAEVVLVIVPDV